MKHRVVLALTAALALTPLYAQNAQPTAPANGVTSDESPEQRTLQKVEDAWSDAFNHRDQYGLELALSPLFIDVASNGTVTSRNQQVAQLINGEDKTLTLSQHVLTVRVLGDVAVANGTYTLGHRVKDGMVNEKGIFTHVFTRTRGNWVCVNSQRTLIRQDQPVAADKKRSSGNGDLPFHLPFFSKDKDADNSTTSPK